LERKVNEATSASGSRGTCGSARSTSVGGPGTRRDRLRRCHRRQAERPSCLPCPWTAAAVVWKDLSLLRFRFLRVPWLVRFLLQKNRWPHRRRDRQGAVAQCLGRGDRSAGRGHRESFEVLRLWGPHCPVRCGPAGRTNSVRGHRELDTFQQALDRVAAAPLRAKAPRQGRGRQSHPWSVHQVAAGSIPRTVIQRRWEAGSLPQHASSALAAVRHHQEVARLGVEAARLHREVTRLGEEAAALHREVTRLGVEAAQPRRAAVERTNRVEAAQPRRAAVERTNRVEAAPNHSVVRCGRLNGTVSLQAWVGRRAFLLGEVAWNSCPVFDS